MCLETSLAMFKKDTILNIVDYVECKTKWFPSFGFLIYLPRRTCDWFQYEPCHIWNPVDSDWKLIRAIHWTRRKLRHELSKELQICNLCRYPRSWDVYRAGSRHIRLLFSKIQKQKAMYLYAIGQFLKQFMRKKYVCVVKFSQNTTICWIRLIYRHFVIGWWFSRWIIDHYNNSFRIGSMKAS